MTVNEMMTALSNRIEDSADRDFTEAEKLDSLEAAQLSIINYLHDSYFTEIEERQFDISTATVSGDDESSMAISALTYSAIRILSVKIKDGEYATPVDYQEFLRRRENSLLTGTDENPIYTIHNDRIYIQTTTDNPAIDVSYLRKPSELKHIYTSAAASGSTATYVKKVNLTEASLSSTTNDYYNGAVLYNKTKEYYAMIYDYYGNTKIMIVIYDKNESSWESADEWHFVKGQGIEENLDDFSSDLNVTLHDLIVALAEADLWKQDKNYSRADAALKGAVTRFEIMNAKVAA